MPEDIIDLTDYQWEADQEAFFTQNEAPLVDFQAEFAAQCARVCTVRAAARVGAEDLTLTLTLATTGATSRTPTADAEQEESVVAKSLVSLSPVFLRSP